MPLLSPKPIKFHLLAIVLSFGLLASAQTRQPIRAPHAMVVTVHPVASQVGVDIMKSGGNAVDSAVAVGFALAVVHPQAGNLGGGGFLLLRQKNGTTRFVDFREKAPAEATSDMYLDSKGKPISDLSIVGYKAIGVPGSVAGLTYAQKRYGKLSLTKVMAPAIQLARDGYKLTAGDAAALHDPLLSKFPLSKQIFQRNGNFYKAGELFRQPELARTLERIAKDPSGFYHGTLARELSTDIQKHKGLVTLKDLEDYEVKEREPIHGTYRGLDIYSAPPPSSGGVALVEALNILEGFDLHKLGSRSADSIHLVTEAFRRIFFDRAEFMADPDFASVPVAQLIDKRYAESWRQNLDPRRASVSTELERPAEFTQLERYAKTTPLLPIREPENTTHYSVVDPEGNAVAVTTTLNESFGSGVTAEGLGFLLNDEMDDFTSAPGVPNLYGLIQGPANQIESGKRPLSTMTPTIVTKDGKLFLILGSPGGPTIISTVANVLIGVVDFGMNLQEAVDAPRFHHQWLPDALRVENGIAPETLKALGDRGHKIERRDSWGDAECVGVDPATGALLGASDKRNGGRAIGY